MVWDQEPLYMKIIDYFIYSLYMHACVKDCVYFSEKLTVINGYSIITIHAKVPYNAVISKQNQRAASSRVDSLYLPFIRRRSLLCAEVCT